LTIQIFLSSRFNMVKGSTFAFASAILGFVQAEHWKHGPTFGWRTYRGKATIFSAETTLLAGPPPSPATPRLALWPGMDTMGGLIQPIIVATTNEYA
jgi:hypothetical protein